MTHLTWWRLRAISVFSFTSILLSSRECLSASSSCPLIGLEFSISRCRRSACISTPWTALMSWSCLSCALASYKPHDRNTLNIDRNRDGNKLNRDRGKPVQSHETKSSKWYHRQILKYRLSQSIHVLWWKYLKMLRNYTVPNIGKTSQFSNWQLAPGCYSLAQAHTSSASRAILFLAASSSSFLLDGLYCWLSVCLSSSSSLIFCLSYCWFNFRISANSRCKG